MATGSKKVHMFNKRILSLEDWRDRVLDYTAGAVESALSRIFRSDGAFDTQVTVAASASPNKVDIAAAAAFASTDGDGHLLEGSAGESYLQGIKIPPDPGATDLYHLGFEFALTDQGVVTNPRTGEYEYDYFEEEIGVLGTPDSVAVEGGGLRVTVNSLLESGYDHSGRTVRVWLKSVQDGGPGPQSQDADVAFEEVAVTYSNPNNSILTTAHLGQDSPSTTAADYRVLLIGPKIKRKAVQDLTGVAGVVYLAEVTAAASGNTISSIDLSLQNLHGDLAIFAQDFIEYDPVNAHAKVAVQVYAGEAADQRQISVLDTGGTPVFKVDKDGDVTMSGDLVVGGSETITDVEIVLGSTEVGDDPSTDTMELWSQLRLHAGEKTDSAPYDRWSNLYIGDDDEADPGGKIIFAASSIDREIYAESSGITIRRNDAVGGESYLEVRNDGGGGVFGIKTDGPIFLGINPSGSSPPLFFYGNSGYWEMYYDNTLRYLVAQISDPSERYFWIRNTGVGRGGLRIEDGEILMRGSPAKLRGDTGAGPLYLDDQYITPSAGIPLSSNSETGGTQLNTGAQSLLGAIDEIRTASAGLRVSGVQENLNDLALSITGSSPPKVTVNTGSAIVNGVRYTYSGTTELTLATNQTNYIYITNAGTITSTTTQATAYPAAGDTLVLGAAVTDSSAVTDLRSGRPFIGTVGRRHVVTVGSSADPDSLCDFANLFEALNWVRDVRAQLTSMEWPEIEIVIVGTTDLTGLGGYDLRPEHSGLTIRGVGHADESAWWGYGTESDFGTAAIIWEGTGTPSWLFRTQGSPSVTNITFRDLTFVYEHTGSYVNSNLFYVGTATWDIAFLHCRILNRYNDYPWRTFVGAYGGSIYNLRVSDCRFSNCMTDPAGVTVFRSDTASYQFHRLLVEDCRFYWNTGSVTPTIFNIEGGTSTITIRDCESNTARIFAQIANAETVHISKCESSVTGVGGTQGGVIVTGATYTHISDCKFTGSASSGETIYGIRLTAGHAFIRDNYINITGTGTLTRGIETNYSTDHGLTIAGNSGYIAAGKFIYNTCQNTTITGNHGTASGTDAIYNDGNYCSITGNCCIGGAYMNDITSTGAYCTVIGNILDGSLSVSGTGSIGDATLNAIVP